MKIPALKRLWAACIVATCLMLATPAWASQVRWALERIPAGRRLARLPDALRRSLYGLLPTDQHVHWQVHRSGQGLCQERFLSLANVLQRQLFQKL